NGGIVLARQARAAGRLLPAAGHHRPVTRRAAPLALHPARRSLVHWPQRRSLSRMQRYRYEIDNVRSHLHSLWMVIGLLLAVIFGLWIAWMRMPSTITVHIPPDLRAGAVLDLNEVPRANVYTFALYVFQQLNRWPEDGAEDYGKAIFRIAPYLTPNFREALITDMQTKARQGEL